MSRPFMALAAHAGAGAGGGSAFTASLSLTGEGAAGTVPGHTFANNTVTPSGGLAPYTHYAWTISGDANGSWSVTGDGVTTGQNTPTVKPQVASVAGAGTVSFATLYCVVTDSNGLTATSDTAVYSYENDREVGGGGNP